MLLKETQKKNVNKVELLHLLRIVKNTNSLLRLPALDELIAYAGLNLEGKKTKPKAATYRKCDTFFLYNQRKRVARLVKFVKEKLHK